MLKNCLLILQKFFLGEMLELVIRELLRKVKELI